MRPNGNRTHEPSLREVTAEIDGLNDLLDERDKRYDERFRAQQKAVEDAFKAAEKLTDAAFKASETAILKAEEAQRNYNERSNEFRSSLDDANKNNMPRTEAEGKFKVYDDKIDDAKKQIELLRLIGGERRGKDAGISGAWNLLVQVITLAVMVAGFLIMISKLGGG